MTLKRLLFISSIFCSLLSTKGLLAQTWTALNSGTTNSLLGVSATHADTCFISGGAGKILKTTNGGVSWTTQNSGTTQDLYALHFKDGNNGYAVGNNATAIRTTNGGATWTPMNLPAASTVLFRFVYFFDNNIGYITGATTGVAGFIYKTTDGGNTWTSIANPSTAGVYSIYFNSASEGYANDYDGNIIKTIDGGVNWTLYSTGSNIFNGTLLFTGTSTGFVSGMNGKIYKTNDAGTSWNTLTTGTSDALTGMDFYDNSNGFAVGGDVGANTGTILKTNDAGSNWTSVTLPSGTKRLFRINCFDQNVAYAVGLNGTILKYSSCPLGNGWTSLTSGTTNSLLGVSATHADTCFISGGAGKILKTTNGGVSWTTQNSGTTEDLYALHFKDGNNGYAVGNNATAIRTANGGATWTPMNLPAASTVLFRYVYFFDNNIGYITGATTGVAGFIYKTTDGGNTWTSITNPSTAGVYSIYFNSASEGYANDYDGNIIKTIDGGSNWTLYSTGSNIFNGTLLFTDTSTGFVSGMNGKIYKTNDAGTSWNTLTTGTSDALTGMDFHDNSNGFAVGGDVGANTGTILKTNDAGSNWTSVTPPSGTKRLFRINCFNQNVAYAVGLNGTILKYEACPQITTSLTEYTKNENNFNNSIFYAYPNPFTNNTIIDFKNYIFEELASIELFDVSGKMVRKSENITKSNHYELQRELLPSGLYFFRIYDSKKMIGNGKFIIQ